MQTTSSLLFTHRLGRKDLLIPRALLTPAAVQSHLRVVIIALEFLRALGTENVIGTEPIVTHPAFHNHDNLVAYTAVSIEGLSHSREGDILDFSHLSHIVQ